MSLLSVKPMSAHHTTKRLYQAGRVSRGSQTALPILLQMGRDALPHLCRDLGFRRGAEIGVWKGAYAAKFCHYMHMLCVDPWVSYPAWVDTKNSLEPEAQTQLMADAYAEALYRLQPLNCTIVRAFSRQAAAHVKDASLDFVYIDANHVYDAVQDDLTVWAPKVKSGGIIAGHDFRRFSNKPMIHVVDAVTDYTQAHGIDPWFVLARDKTPSWLWVVASTPTPPPLWNELYDTCSKCGVMKPCVVHPDGVSG